MKLFLKKTRFKSVYSPMLLVMFLPGMAIAKSSGLNIADSKIEVGSRVISKFIGITGTVRDGKGEPLAGVTVTIKGTKTSTATDGNGVFRLNLPTGNETLVFNFLGFQTKEVQAGGSTKLTVVLEETTSTLNEVVVVGYGEQKKEHLTGSVETVNMSEIQELPLGNLGAALTSRVLGLGVSGGTTRPGSAATLTVRNPRTYSKDGQGTNPLIVIDDIIQLGPTGDPDNTLFNNLDPTEIESISIVKDGAAAIYGAKGANGVIIVRTKKGKEGAPRISYSGSYAVNDEVYRSKMLSAYDFAMYYNIMNGPNGDRRDPNSSNANDYFFSQDELDYFKNIDYDWLDAAWKSSSNMRHTLNVSGGTDKATYFAGMSYYSQDGNLSSLDYNRWNFRAGSDVKIAQRFKVGLQVSGNYSNLQKTFNKIGGEEVENDYRNLLRAPRYIPMYLNGNAVKLPHPSEAFSRYHFFEIERLGNLAKDKTSNMTLNLFAEYDVPFVKGLKARASYGRNEGNNNGSQVGTVYRLYEFNGSGENGHIYDENATVKTSKEWENGNRLYYSNYNAKSYQLNFTLNYERTFNKHFIGGLFSVEKGEGESGQQDVWKGSPSPLYTNGQFGTAFGAIDGKTTGSESGSLSYVGRANYRYDDKYLAEFLFRTDASTKYAPENYWGKFYSLSTGWVISKEDFFNISGVDFLKIRYSLGLMGRDEMKAWLWRQRYTFQNGKGAVFGSDNTPASIGMKMEASPNRNAKWSDEIKNNIGIDASFLRDRLSTTLEGFLNKGKNMLIERTGNIPVTIGGTVAPENYANVNSYGVEFSIGWRDKIGSDFNYGVDARFNWYDRKVLKGNFNDIDILYPWKARPNQSEDIGIWGYDYLGMFKNQEEIDAYIQKYNITSVHETAAADLRPGMLYYRDVRGPLQADGTFAAPDGIIDENDQIQIAKKESNPYGLGFTLKASYKGFSFDCVIGGSFGGKSLISNSDIKKLKNKISEGYQNVPALWSNIYDPDLNPSGTMPNPHHEKVNMVASQFWLRSGFRMKMRNINVGYNLPKSVLQKINVNNCRIFFTAVNPIDFYNPFDYKYSEGSFDVFPTLKTYSFGLNFTL